MNRQLMFQNKISLRFELSLSTFFKTSYACVLLLFVYACFFIPSPFLKLFDPPPLSKMYTLAFDFTVQVSVHDALS